MLNLTKEARDNDHLPAVEINEHITIFTTDTFAISPAHCLAFAVSQ